MNGSLDWGRRAPNAKHKLWPHVLILLISWEDVSELLSMVWPFTRLDNVKAESPACSLAQGDGGRGQREGRDPGCPVGRTPLLSVLRGWTPIPDPCRDKVGWDRP